MPAWISVSTRPIAERSLKVRTAVGRGSEWRTGLRCPCPGLLGVAPVDHLKLVAEPVTTDGCLVPRAAQARHLAAAAVDVGEAAVTELGQVVDGLRDALVAARITSTPADGTGRPTITTGSCRSRAARCSAGASGPISTKASTASRAASRPRAARRECE